MFTSLIYSTPISVLLKVIVQTYFNNSYCTSIISDGIVDIDNYNKSIILIKADKYIYLHILNILNKGCTDFIIEMNQPEVFMKAYEKASHKAIQRKSHRKFIFLPIKNNLQNINNIIFMKESLYVANILLIIPLENNVFDDNNCKVYDLVTRDFAGPNVLEKPPIYLDRWNSCTKLFDKNVNLFPYEDFSDLNGKVIKLATLQYVPFAVLNFEKYEKPLLGRDGVEVKIIEEFCFISNCTLTIVRDDNEWGEIYENLTGTGVLGNVLMDKADMGVGGLYLGWYEAYKYLDFSDPSLRAGVTCLVPAARLLASWGLPLLPFSYFTWLALFFTFLFSCFALFQAKRFNSDKVFLTTFGLMTIQAEAHPDKDWRIRRVTCWLLITGLVIDNAYGAGLAYTYTIPKHEKSIDTIEDIIERKLEWGSTHEAWTFSIRLSEQDRIKSLLSLYRVLPKKELIRRSFKKDMGFVLEKLPAGSTALPEHIKPEALEYLSLMNRNLYYEQCVVALRKNSPYTQKINKLIGRLRQAGILKAWEFQMSFKYLPLKEQLAIKLSKTRKEKESFDPLNVNNIVGIYVLFLVGVVLSVMLFFSEIYYKKYLMTKKKKLSLRTRLK